MTYFLESGRDLIGSFKSIDKAKEAKEELERYGMKGIIVCSDGSIIK